MLTFIFRVSLLTLAVAWSSQASEFLVIDPSDPEGGTFVGEGYVRTVGYEFAVGELPLSVTALGVRDWLGTGLASFHDVGLWDGGGYLLTSVTVSPGSGTEGFRYAQLPSEIILAPGSMYTVGATYVNLDPDRIGRSDVRDGASPPYSPAVTFKQIRYDDDLLGLVYPQIVGYPEEVGLFGPNVRFEVVPEPTAMLLLTGALLLVCALRAAERVWPNQSCPPNAGGAPP